jgi:hypothetical protein
VNPLAPFQFLILVWRFAKGVPNYLADDKTILDAVPEHLQLELQKISKRCVRYALFGALLVVVIVPAIAVWYVSQRDGLTGKDATGRFIMMLCMAPVTFFLGVFGGISLGICRSPRWFLECPLGEKWVRLSGAKSVDVAKEVAFLVVATTVAYFVATFWLVSVMAPFD